MDNRRTIFAVRLYRETNLSVVDSQILVKEIPNKFLNEAIKVYKKFGYTQLVDFIVENQNKTKEQ